MPWNSGAPAVDESGIPEGAEAALRLLRQNAARWRNAAASERVKLARQCLGQLRSFSSIGETWLQDCLDNTGRPASVVAAETRFKIVSVAEAFLRTFIAVQTGERTPPQVKKEADAYRIYDVPTDPLNPMKSAEIWADPRDEAVRGFERPPPKDEGRVCLVLAAGNDNMLALRDVLERLFLHDEVVLLKHHPLRPYLAAPYAHVLAPLEQAGVYMQVQDPGNIPQSAAIVRHPAVRHVHLTGGPATHRALRKTLDEVGKRDTEITSELGACTPWVLLPDGDASHEAGWTTSTLKHYAYNLAIIKCQNGGAYCLSPQVLVMPAGWKHKDEFIGFLKEAFETESFAAPANYYPGSTERCAARAELAKAKGAEVTMLRPKAELDDSELAELHANKNLVATPRNYEVAFIDLGVADISDVSGWVAKYKDFLQEEAFGPLLVAVEVPCFSAETVDVLTSLATFSNAHVGGSLSMTVLAPPSIPVDVLDDAFISKLKWGSVCVNAWSAFAYIVIDGVWGAYPGLYSDRDVGSGNAQIGNPFKLPGARKTVVRGDFSNPAIDFRKQTPNAVMAAICEFTAQQSAGTAVAIVRALWTLVTAPCRKAVNV